MASTLAAMERSLLSSVRRATLATIGPDGRPRLVPCCFAVVEGASGLMLYSPVDDKPKAAADPRSLARIGDIERDARVTLLADHWDEDWARLAWVRVDGDARVVWPTDDAAHHAIAVAALRARYPQYASHDLERLPIIAITPLGWRSWFASGAEAHSGG